MFLSSEPPFDLKSWFIAAGLFLYIENVCLENEKKSKVTWQYWSNTEVWAMYGDVCARALRILDLQKISHISYFGQIWANLMLLGVLKNGLWLENLKLESSEEFSHS